MLCNFFDNMPFSSLDFIALSVFVGCWLGYTYFARKKAKSTNCIARCLHQHRIHWMNELIKRDFRVGDTALLANLERNIAFFASTTLIILAGVLTLFAQVAKLETVIGSLPFAQFPEHFAIQLKLSLLVFIFILAFFQFTWSMRQYGFLNVMIGAAPVDLSGESDNLKKYAMQMAIVQDQAAHSYNYGLRSYYFSLAVLTWFIHPIFFMLASAFVVYTLFNREFNSKAVKAITVGQECLKNHDQKA
jgi:uncharacterized membrane protein